jgi:hypothetical protein
MRECGQDAVREEEVMRWEEKKEVCLNRPEV